ncbi:deoxynucleoside triphosphate triphosphohydrolase SAMHD1-like [Pholidichthys leucotaenia]
MKTRQKNIPELIKELELKSQLDQHFEVLRVTFNYGMKDEDPIDHTYFYSKTDPKNRFKIPKEQRSKLLPECFSEHLIRVYLKDDGGITVKQARKSFKEWCLKNDFADPQDESRAETQEAEDQTDGDS